MKSPRVLSRLASPRSGRGGEGDEARGETLRIVAARKKEPRRDDKKARRSTPTKVPRRNVTLTHSSSESESDENNVEDESRNEEEAERDANLVVDEEEEDDDDDYDDDEDAGSCYSGGSEYSSADEGRAKRPRRILMALNFRRVFSSHRRRRRRQLFRRRGGRSDDDDESDSDFDSEYDSQLSNSSYETDEEDAATDDDQAGTDDDDDDVEAEVAAETLGKDLEAMGYDLNCESFITKGSSVNPDEERYAPPLGSAKARKTSKAKKKKNAPAKKKVGEKKLAPLEEEESDRELSEEDERAPKTTKATKPSKDKDDAASDDDGDHHKPPRGKTKLGNPSKDETSVGSLSNPSDVMERSLQTNTSSKLIGKGRGVQKYGRPFSPANMESLASLRELVDLTKRHKRTIAPPAIAVYEAKQQQQQPPKEVLAQRKSPARQAANADGDDAESIAAMSADDKVAHTKSKKTGKGKAAQARSTLDKAGAGDKAATVQKPSNSASKKNDDQDDPDVIIEGMSVVHAGQDKGKRREGMEPYKQLLPDPPEKDVDEVLPRNLVVPKLQPSYRPTASHTTATALSSPDQDTRLQPRVFPAEAVVAERPKKRFFALPSMGRKEKPSQAPRVPNLPQTPKATVVDMSKTPKNESTVKKFQLPAPILTKEEPTDVQARAQPTPTAFKLPSSIREARKLTDNDADVNSRLAAARDSSRAKRLSPVHDVIGAVMQNARNTLSPKSKSQSKPNIDRFFATVGSTDRAADEETMAPGQIEVTFDNMSLVEGDLIPVGKFEPPASTTPKKWNPLSPRSRDPPTGPMSPPPDPPLEDNSELDADIEDEANRRSPILQLIPMQIVKAQREYVPQPQPASEPRKGFALLSMFNRMRSEARTDTAVANSESAFAPVAPAVQLPERAIKLRMEHETDNSPCPQVKSGDTTFQGLEGHRDATVDAKEVLQDEEAEPIGEEIPTKPRANAQSFDRVRSAPVTRSDLKSAMEDLMITVFHPEKLAEREKASSEQTRNGVLQDWFNLDLLGSLDWAATRSQERRKAKARKKSRRDDEDEIMPPHSSTITTTQSHSFQTQTLPTQTQSLLSQSLITEGNQRSLADRATESVPAPRQAANATTASSVAVAPTVVTSLATATEDGLPVMAPQKKGLFRMLRTQNHSRNPNLRPHDDRMSTGISSSEPSSQYHVEYNDDNDPKPAGNRAAPSRPALNKKRLEVPPRHQMPILVDSPAHVPPKTAGLRSKFPMPKDTPTSDAAVNASRSITLPNSATLSTYPTASYANNINATTAQLDSYLPSDTSSDADTWVEIADASMVVERAMERLDTFRSDDDTEDPGRLKFLLSVVSDDDTLGDVEKALNTLKKHASRLGVKETDLLMAVGSHGGGGGTPRSAAEESDSRSYRSMTLGEELLNIFGMFVKPPTQQTSSRRRKGGRSSHRRSKRSSYTYR